MKEAQSYQYKGIPIALSLNPQHDKGTYSVGNKTVTVNTTDFNLLKQLAEALVDNEKNGDIFNFSN